MYKVAYFSIVFQIVEEDYQHALRGHISYLHCSNLMG